VALVALVELWRNSLSAAFVIATLGIVAWFLSYRTQMKAKIAADNASEPSEGSDEE
jgi:hypothetical protein